MDDMLLEQYEVQDEGFQVNNDNIADWSIKKIKEEQEEAKRIIAIAEDQIAKLKDQIAEIEERTERRTGYLKGKLLEYFNTVDLKETKTQLSYQLLSGKLVLKKPAQKMVPDKEKLLEVCKTHNMPEYIKVKEEVDWAKYKAECEIVDGQVVNVQTGDILDYVAVEYVPASFDIK